MISEVLSESLAKIEEFQSRFPGSYDEIEQVKQAMTRLLIRLDAPPEMTPEGWAEGMIRLSETDPIRLKELTCNRVYKARRMLVSEALGPGHPALIRLLEAEQEAERHGECDLAEALEAYTDPSNPEYDPKSTGRSVHSGQTGSRTPIKIDG